MEKGILGPHEGKELELMLRGEKQVALFNQELGIPDAFLGSQEFGRFHVLLLDQNHSQCLQEVTLPFVQRVQEIEVNRQ